MSNTFKSILNVFILTVAALLVSTSSSIASLTETCASATPLELDTIYRGSNARGEVFVLYVPTPGIVALDVTVPGAAMVEPKLGFLGARCSTAADPDAATVERKAARQTVAIRTAGEYYFRVAAQDPQQTLEDYKVNIRFAAAEIVEGHFEMDLGNGQGRAPVRQSDFFIDSDKVDEQQVDPDPNGFDNEPILSLFTVYDSELEKVDEQQVDPDPNGILDDTGIEKVDEQQVDPDPNGILDDTGIEKVDEQQVDPDPNGIDGKLETIVIVHEENDLAGSYCRNSKTDDHSDLTACATALSVGTTIAGQIENQWGDDADVFAIEISSPQTLLITTTGETDTFGSLRDQFGQRLASSNDSGDSTNFRIVKSLDVGLHFLVVEGARGSEGPFELTIERLDW